MSTLPCPPDHWPRFSTLLDTALELDGPARVAWLRALQGDDEKLRPWLDRVLNSPASASTADFLEFPRLTLPDDAEFAPGDMVGPYRLELALGAGGMGRVWRAIRQDEGPQRPVALKLPYAEMLTGPFRERFRRERDVLSGLAHPHIAALYDAGLSNTGHPYLALELVTGQSITAWCATAALEQRIDKLVEVLSALAYAHARLIVHRDIKPSNVMVTREGVVKLLDFGIAKLLDTSSLPGGLPLTGGLRMATSGYAPPEQRNGVVTVTTDLFAAGVLLFELCTGERPWPRHAGETPAPLASSRADKPIARRLRGDLDAVIATALATDPARRYASADAFARDLQRWRAGLPVSARHISRPALAGKFIRRHQAATCLAAVLVLAIITGGAGIAWQAGRAEREARRATEIKDFMVTLFEQGDPRQGGASEDMTAKQLLDAGADRIDTVFAHDPAAAIPLLQTLGDIYDALDDAGRAERVREKQLDLSRTVYGAADPRVIAATLMLVGSEVEFLDASRARVLLEAIRAPLFAHYGPSTLQRAQWLLGHAKSLRITHGARDQAIAEDQAAIAIFRAYFPTAPNYPDALNDLSGYDYDGEQYAASLALLDQAKSIEQAAHDFDAMDDLTYSSESATRLEHLGRIAAADAAYAQAMDQAGRQLGLQNIWYLHALISRAQMADLAGDRLRAHMLFQVAEQLAGPGAGTGQAALLHRAYGAALAREGRPGVALPYLQAALAETAQHPHDEPNLRRTQMLLGDTYDQLGRPDEARPLLLAARDGWMRFGDGQIQELAARERWARFLLDHGQATQAAAEYRAVLAQAGGAPSAPAALASIGLARIALASTALVSTTLASTTLADRQDAAPASAQAMTTIAATTAEYDVRARIDIWLIRAEVLQTQGRAQAAHALAQQALALAQQADAPNSLRIRRAQALLAG